MTELRGQTVARWIDASVQQLLLGEVAAFRTFDDEGRQTFHVATDVGLYIATHTPRGPDIRSEATLEGQVVPWSVVRGARMTTTGFAGGRDNDFTVTVRIEHPVFTHTSYRGDQPELIAFGCAVMKLAAGEESPNSAPTQVADASPG